MSSTPPTTPLASENELIAVRQKKAEDLRAAGINPYPDADAFRPDDRLADGSGATLSAALLAKYEGQAAEALETLTTRHRVAGRLIANRIQGKAGFAELRDRDGSVQLYVRFDDLGPELRALWQSVDLGDFVGAEGTPMRTRTGAFALKVTALAFLGKAQRPLPKEHFGIADKETRYRQRYADLAVNRDVQATFRMRSRIVRSIRNFLDSRGFLEVETPMMHPLAGGAAARPFVTHHNAQDLQLYMRIAPELYLKRLVVGGLDRVYEINRNFRNEGMDLQHNPEFTMLEFYAAYQTYRDLMDLTEDLVSGLASELHGKPTLEYHYDLNDREKVHALSFAKPWRRVTIHDAVAEVVKVPRATLETLEGAVAAYEAAFRSDADAATKLAKIRKLHAKSDPRIAAGHVVYAIFEERVEKTLIQPTFVHDFPIAVSPLARSSDRDATLADRFELFVAGREIANAFSELNDPRDQEARFKGQMDAKAGGDDEAMPYDADYVRALEYGLPPTAGEGIGIDRLVMLLTDQASIRDVILFPLMRPER